MAPQPIPKDGTLITDDDGHKYVLYQVGNWWAKYDLGNAEQAAQYDLTGFQSEGGRYWNGIDILNTPKVVGGGADSVAFLVALGQSGTTMADHWQKSINIFHNEARGDDGIQRLTLDAMMRPSMSSTEFQQLTEQTDWYQKHNNQQRIYGDASDAEKTAMVSNARESLRKNYYDTFGAMPQDVQIEQYAQDVAKGNMNTGAVVTAMRNQAAGDPESPWSRALRKETEDRGAYGQQVSDMANNMRTTADRWGVQLTDKTLNDWGSQVIGKTRSTADFENMLKDQSQAMYPNKPRELATIDYAQPWMQNYQRLLEKSDGTLTNPVISSALQRGVNLSDFQTELRQRPEWMNTQNAKDQLTTSVAQLGAHMGFQ